MITMAAKKGFMGTRQKKDIGKMAFIGGFVIALLVGIVVAALGEGALGEYAKYITVLLVILGLLVGLLNVSGREAPTFLIAAIALGMGNTLYNYFSTLPYVGVYLVSIFSNVAAFIAPAAAIVALVEIWKLGKGA